MYIKNNIEKGRLLGLLVLTFIILTLFRAPVAEALSGAPYRISPMIPSGQLLAHFGFEEGSGFLATNDGPTDVVSGIITGISNPASLVSGWTNAGKSGKGLNFDGINDAVNMGSHTSIDDLLNRDVTFSIWINPTSCNSTSFLAGKSNGGMIGFYIYGSYGSCNPRFDAYHSTTRATYISASNSITPGQWNHVAFVWHASTKSVQIFVNGVEVNYSSQIAGGGNYNSDAGGNLIWGNWHPLAGSSFYQGTMDDIRIYSYAQSSAQIMTDMNSGVPLTITTSSPLPDANAGTNYLTNIVASSNNSSSFYFSSNSLPQGMSLINSTGMSCGSNGVCYGSAELSGTPVSAGTYIFTISVAQGSQTVSKSFTLVVNSEASTITNPPTLVLSSSTASQFVPAGNTGANNITKATYKFMSTNGASTISELKFSVTDATTVASITVNGISAPFVGTTVYLTGLNIAVPNGGSGLNADVFVSYAPVGAHGAASGSTSRIALEYIKYSNSSGTTSTLCTVAIDGGCAATLANAVAAPTMKLVGSRPTLNLASSGSVLTPGLVNIGNVTVFTDAKGDISLNSLPVSIALQNATIGSNLVVKDTNGTVVPTSNTPLSSTGGASTITFTDSGGFRMVAGTSKTFKIYLSVNTVSTNSIVFLALGSVNNLSWTDLAGNASSPATENNIYFYNYPTNTVSVSN